MSLFICHMLLQLRARALGADAIATKTLRWVLPDPAGSRSTIHGSKTIPYGRWFSIRKRTGTRLVLALSAGRRTSNKAAAASC